MDSCLRRNDILNLQAVKDTLRRQPPVDLRYPVRELANVVDEDIADLAVHVRQIGLGLLVDGDAEGVDALLAGLEEGLPRVLDPVVTLVRVPVLGLPVAQGDEKPGPRLD